MALGEVAGGGSKRSLNSEINMVPMIDLLVCCITFLMLTAVWSTQGRVTAEGAMPGSSGEISPNSQRAKLHVTASGAEPFTVSWREQGSVVRSVQVPRGASADGRLTELAEALRREWSARPESARDGAPVQAVVHVDNRVRYGEVAAILGTLQSPRERAREAPTFVASLAE